MSLICPGGERLILKKAVTTEYTEKRRVKPMSYLTQYLTFLVYFF
jgi:hypothetical protein